MNHQDTEDTEKYRGVSATSSFFSALSMSWWFVLLAGLSARLPGPSRHATRDLECDTPLFHGFEEPSVDLPLRRGRCWRRLTGDAFDRPQAGTPEFPCVLLALGHAAQRTN